MKRSRVILNQKNSLLILVLVFLGSCKDSEGIKEISFTDLDISRKIENFPKGDGEYLELDFDNIELDWSHMHVFGPYTPRDSVEKQLGHQWDDRNHPARIDRTDAYHLLVFRKEKETQGYLYWPNNKGDFSLRDGSGKMYRRSNSKFMVFRDSTNASRWLFIRETR